MRTLRLRGVGVQRQHEHFSRQRCYDRMQGGFRRDISSDKRRYVGIVRELQRFSSIPPLLYRSISNHGGFNRLNSSIIGATLTQEQGVHCQTDRCSVVSFRNAHASFGYSNSVWFSSRFFFTRMTRRDDSSYVTHLTNESDLTWYYRQSRPLNMMYGVWCIKYVYMHEKVNYDFDSNQIIKPGSFLLQ